LNEKTKKELVNSDIEDGYTLVDRSFDFGRCDLIGILILNKRFEDHLIPSQI